MSGVSCLSTYFAARPAGTPTQIDDRPGTVSGVSDLVQAAAWHRQVAALAVAADRAGVAQPELPAVRARLLTQRARFGELAARAGQPLPALTPTPTDVAAAAAALGDMSPAAVGRAMQSAFATLDAADAAIQAALASDIRPATAPASAARAATAAPAVPATAPAAALPGHPRPSFWPARGP